MTLTWAGQTVAATRDIIAGMQVSKSFLVDYLVVSVSVPLGISGSLKYQKQNSEFLVLLHEFHREACLLLSQQTNNQLTELPRKAHRHHPDPHCHIRSPPASHTLLLLCVLEKMTSLSSLALVTHRKGAKHLNTINLDGQPHLLSFSKEVEPKSGLMNLLTAPLSLILNSSCTNSSPGVPQTLHSPENREMEARVC